MKIGDPHLHLLNVDGTLAIGNGGESYDLLDLEGHAEYLPCCSQSQSALSWELRGV